MNTKSLAAVAAAAGTLLVTGLAGAQENASPKDEGQASGREFNHYVAPATRALELGVQSGYTQGIGDVASGLPSLYGVAHAGGAVEASVGYRIVPQLSLGVYGSGSVFSRGDQVDDTTNIYSANAGVQGVAHVLPDRLLDPWVSLGTGWRGYWLDSSKGTTSMHGWQIARLQVGLDIRATQAVAVGPVVGADLTAFFTREEAGQNSYYSVNAPYLNTFVFAGLQGRFDIPTGGNGGTDVAMR